MALTTGIGYISMGKQSSQGTAVPPTDFYRWNTLSAQPKMTIKPYRASETRDVAFSAKVQQWVEGKFQTYLYPTETAKLLSYAISATDGIAGGGDPYTHTGSSASAQPPWLTFEWGQGNNQDVVRCTDCMINSFDIAGKAGDLAMVDVGFVGRIAVPGGTPASVSFSTDRPLLFLDGTPTFGSLNVGSSFFTNLAFHLKQPVEILPVYGSLAPQLLANGRDLGIDFEMLPGATAPFRDIFFGGDAATAAVAAPFLLSTVVMNWDIGGSPDHSFQLTAGNVECLDAVPKFDKDGKAFTLAGKGTAKLLGGTPVLAYSSKCSASIVW